MMDLKPLDLVECIDDTPDLATSKTMPQLGQVYRVASVRAVENGASVRLFEIQPECYLTGPCQCGDCGWDARRFRKLDRSGEEQASRSASSPIARKQTEDA
ncbi:hypothetical protein GRI89_14175 [Altererythrobacter salegens]|uniref:Uncharacterized protein n=1 Tax=Croceibacterium salegens TaxID=1737568 RepID=A0A6I4T084_9SPHN|nr:hypothetical protein [Croceibacterium salegens]MXO60687.1 hypothetical protein [Croceibacterium salegens]